MRRLTFLPLLAFAPLVFLSGCDDDASPFQPGDHGVTSGPEGSLQIAIETTGEDIDVDGCTFSLDCGCYIAMEANEVTTMTGIAEGQHMVLLMGLAENCQLSGPNPRWVNITAGETTRATFSIACTE